jgi:hypothetical protein
VPEILQHSIELRKTLSSSLGQYNLPGLQHGVREQGGTYDSHCVKTRGQSSVQKVQIDIYIPSNAKKAQAV